LYFTLLYFTVLCCTLLYATLLYSTVLCLTLFYSTVLYCLFLYCTVLYSTVMCSVVLYSILLYCVALYFTVLYILYFTVLHSTLQYSIVLCCLYCTIHYRLYPVVAVSKQVPKFLYRLGRTDRLTDSLSLPLVHCALYLSRAFSLNIVASSSLMWGHIATVCKYVVKGRVQTDIRTVPNMLMVHTIV